MPSHSEPFTAPTSTLSSAVVNGRLAFPDATLTELIPFAGFSDAHFASTASDNIMEDVLKIRFAVRAAILPAR